MPFPVFPTVFCSIEQYHIHLSITLSSSQEVSKDCLAGLLWLLGVFSYLRCLLCVGKQKERSLKCIPLAGTVWIKGVQGSRLYSLHAPYNPTSNQFAQSG